MAPLPASVLLPTLAFNSSNAYAPWASFTRVVTLSGGSAGVSTPKALAADLRSLDSTVTATLIPFAFRASFTAPVALMRSCSALPTLASIPDTDRALGDPLTSAASANGPMGGTCCPANLATSASSAPLAATFRFSPSASMGLATLPSTSTVAPPALRVSFSGYGLDGVCSSARAPAVPDSVNAFPL